MVITTCLRGGEKMEGGYLGGGGGDITLWLQIILKCEGGWMSGSVFVALFWTILENHTDNTQNSMLQ